MTETLRITEVFHSLQGETRTMGLPTVFVRLTGCPLRCVWCDSEYSFHGGQQRTLESLVQEVKQFGAPCVTVTGGEPLAQPNAIPLIQALCDEGFDVNVETSGAMDISAVDRRASRVMDLKAPGSGESSRNLYDNIAHLTDNDQVKFVLSDRADYEWTRMQLDRFDLLGRVDEVLLSPVHGHLNPRELAEWIIQDGLRVRMQLQMHKYLWGEEPGH